MENNKTVWVLTQHSQKKAGFGGDEISGIYKSKTFAKLNLENLKSRFQKLSDDESKNLILSGREAPYYTLSEYNIK